MTVHKIKDILNECNLIGRSLAKVCAQRIQIGDTIDFEDFSAVSNSFADEFVKQLLERFGQEGLNSLKFINMSPLLEKLIKKSILLRSTTESKRIAKLEALNAKDIKGQREYIHTFPF